MANKIRYNYELLKNIINENNIKLSEDYSKYKIINRETKIKGKCSNGNCNNEYNKRFESFYRTKSLCEICVKKNSSESTRKTMIEICKNKVVANKIISYKYNLESLNIYIKENNIELLDDYSKYETIRKDTKIKGKCKTFNCINTFEKGFRELRKKGSPYCCYCVYKNMFHKHKENGTHYNYMSDDKKDEIKNKIREKYFDKSDEDIELIKNKRKQTNKIIFNCDYPTQNLEIIKKSKEIINNRTDEEKKIIMEKIKQTNLKRYGVEYATQNPEIMEKSSKNSYSRKKYVSPTGKIFICQGYEPQTLNYLINIDKIDENDIINGETNVPKIEYFDDNNKKHIHYPDIFIKSKNLIIETKSSWTIKKKDDNVFAKQKAAKEQGYLYEIWVMNKKGDILEKHI